MVLKLNRSNSKLEFLYENLNTNSNVIISGGNTLKKLFNKSNKFKKQIKIKNLLLADERLVNLKSRYRNDLYFKTFLKKRIIICKNFYYYKKENYNEKYLKSFSNKISKIHFDTCLLSLGSNCHVASIFDYNISTNLNYFFVDNSPKKPKKRVSISPKLIIDSNKIIIVAQRTKRRKEINDIFKINFFKKLRKKIILIIL
tara:strand:+ start:458 stop:1057 length:600 start_codon:yes stop_codon:yes gene_type:complete